MSVVIGNSVEDLRVVRGALGSQTRSRLDASRADAPLPCASTAVQRGESLTVLILTGNEEHNIYKCLRSLAPLAAKVCIVDSESQDRTREIAASMGAKVFVRKWTTYADQFNWGLSNCGIDSDWVMRMDADEELTPQLAEQLAEFLRAPDPEVSGVWFRRRVYFMGRWIRHGGYYPTWLLRVFRRGAGRCESLNMDEHIILDSGASVELQADIIDKNNKDLTFWTQKHNGYASREVLDILSGHGERTIDGCLEEHAVMSARLAGNQQASTRRWLKTRVYLRLPLFVRPTLYFLYRYVVRLGFLDGREGLIFHFLQGFWYRFLVDAKLYERRHRDE